METKFGKSKEVIKIAVPTILENFITVFTGLVDTMMVSTLGNAAVSAVGLTNQPKVFMFLFIKYEKDKKNKQKINIDNELVPEATIETEEKDGFKEISLKIMYKNS